MCLSHPQIFRSHTAAERAISELRNNDRSYYEGSFKFISKIKGCYYHIFEFATTFAVSSTSYPYQTFPCEASTDSILPAASEVRFEVHVDVACISMKEMENTLELLKAQCLQMIQDMTGEDLFRNMQQTFNTMMTTTKEDSRKRKNETTAVNETVKKFKCDPEAPNESAITNFVVNQLISMHLV